MKNEALKKTYNNFSVYGNKFLPNHSGDNIIPKLEPGSYTMHYDGQRGIFWFEPMILVSDEILDLPSSEYSKIVSEMEFFLTEGVKQQFKDKKFIYKRSTLLHGLPGTGKTIIVNRVAKAVQAMGGITLWVNKSPELLKIAYEILESVQPETLTSVIMEEFDDMARRYESDLLTLLDGQVQKQNVVYLATTNFLDKVPKRLYRPGRFSSVIEVKFPNAEARRVYLVSKLGADFSELNEWVEVTSGLSIDELKEVVQAVYILRYPMAEVLKRLKETKGHVEVPEKEEEYMDDEDEVKSW